MKKAKQTYYNIFQGNELILKTIASSLEYKFNEDDDAYRLSTITENIYFQSYFYLTRRFGPARIYDEYKDGGSWEFQVKQYRITLFLNSSWLTVIIFGKGCKNNFSRKNNFCNYWMRSPYSIRYNREAKRKKHLLLNVISKGWTKREEKIVDKIFKKFAQENGIDDTWSEERFESEMSMKWYEYIEEYNDNIIGVDEEEYNKKYGYIYQNSRTRHALRTVRQFLHNMLTPIYVRNVPFNIKGNLSDEEAYYYRRYHNNIKIEFLKK